MTEIAVRTAYPASVSIGPIQFAAAIRQAASEIKHGAEGRDVKFKRLEGGACPCDSELSGDPAGLHYSLLLVFEEK